MVLQYDVQDHIATIALDRPEVKNALNRELYGRLEQAFRGIGVRHGTRRRHDAHARGAVEAIDERRSRAAGERQVRAGDGI